MVLFWIMWIVFAVLIGFMADGRGRSGLGWALLSFILSPLLCFVILLVIPNLRQQEHQQDLARREEERRQAQSQREHEKQLEALKALSASKPAQEAAPARSVADEIAKLGELRDKGLLTQEEFQAQKATLLKGA